MRLICETILWEGISTCKLEFGSRFKVLKNGWINELGEFSEKYVIHDLYAAYPNGKINVQSEQQLLEKFDQIVFQFPFFWFNCPPLLKQWLDEVLVEGWAFGSNSGYKLSGKKIALAISTGIDKDGYQPTGRGCFTNCVNSVTLNYRHEHGNTRRF